MYLNTNFRHQSQYWYFWMRMGQTNILHPIFKKLPRKFQSFWPKLFWTIFCSKFVGNFYSEWKICKNHVAISLRSKVTAIWKSAKICQNWPSLGMTFDLRAFALTVFQRQVRIPKSLSWWTAIPWVENDMMPGEQILNTILKSKIAYSPLLVLMKIRPIVATEHIQIIVGTPTAVTILQCDIFQDARWSWATLSIFPIWCIVSEVHILWKWRLSNSHFLLAAKKYCPAGWGEPFSDNCYLAVPQEETFGSAEAFCRDNNTNADLVSIYSLYENTHIKQLAKDMGDFVWIGLRDIKTEGSWEWWDQI